MPVFKATAVPATADAPAGVLWTVQDGSTVYAVRVPAKQVLATAGALVQQLLDAARHAQELDAPATPAAVPRPKPGPPPGRKAAAR